MTDFNLPFASFRPSSQSLTELKAQSDFTSLTFEDGSRLSFSEQQGRFVIKKDQTCIPIVQWLNFPIILYLLALRGSH